MSGTAATKDIRRCLIGFDAGMKMDQLKCREMGLCLASMNLVLSRFCAQRQQP